MFGIDFEELIVLAVLAFILFGPQKLPEYAQKLGQLVARLRQASSEMTQQFQPLQKPAEPPQVFQGLTCPICKQKMAPDFTFCPKCGNHVEEEPYPQKPAG